jgi:UDP:flavonoid glycosyltransferase YjiC (YdhE family)
VGVLSQLSGVLPLSVDLRYDIAVILSGPEPQRSRLEEELLEQLERLRGRFVLIRGVPDGDTKVKTGKHIEVVHFAGAEQIARIMAGSQLVVCRSGYSSIMDLQQIRKRALLIPTPGQPEQEYLASWLAGRDQFTVQRQGAVDLRSIWPFAQADTTSN